MTRAAIMSGGVISSYDFILNGSGWNHFCVQEFSGPSLGGDGA